MVSGEQRKDSATHKHIYPFSPKLPSHPGCHIAFSRVPCPSFSFFLYLRSLFPPCLLCCYLAKGKTGQWSCEFVLSPPRWQGRGLRLTFPPANCSSGLELVHCLGLWDPRDWAQAQDLQDTERSPKRIRTMFNLEQLEELEKVFAKQHNIVGKKRAQLAAQLNLTENQVRAGTPVGLGCT